MTISPPANVKKEEIEAPRVLASGIDSLVLAIDLIWESAAFFELLAQGKEAAKTQKKDETPVTIPMGHGYFPWRFTIKPHGSEGYEWLLSNTECSIALANRPMPGSRPSALVSLRSENLWAHSPADCVATIKELFVCVGAEIKTIKTSRADLCVDVLLPESEWFKGLDDSFVTRARTATMHTESKRLTGFQIGRGVVMARLYDKPEEIKSQSHKNWMYDIWKLLNVPENYRVIRVEFQMRREFIKEMGVDTFEDLEKAIPNLWAHLTHEWLKVQHDADKHHTQQTTRAWWKVVQAGYTGAQGARPLVRAKSIRQDIARNSRQAMGLLTSNVALQMRGVLLDSDRVLSAEDHLGMEMYVMLRGRLSDAEFTKLVKMKQTKALRAITKISEAEPLRAALGLSTAPSSKDTSKGKET